MEQLSALYVHIMGWVFGVGIPAVDAAMSNGVSLAQPIITNAVHQPAQWNPATYLGLFLLQAIIPGQRTWFTLSLILLPGLVAWLYFSQDVIHLESIIVAHSPF